MPRKRQARGLWMATRRRILVRDGFRCVRCGIPVDEDTAQIDHIRSGKLGTNEDSNLRSLCRRCHVLRADRRHRGMTSRALEDGTIPPNWRELTWED